jgi:Na+-translocating ferredoxin:NAD+ oxidoreductase RnfC subunit
LSKRLQVEEYEREAPLDRTQWQPASIRVKLKQHAGQAAAPLVQEGKKVKKGQMVGRVEEGKLGANVHASIDGKVRAVTADYIEIVA